MIDTKKSAVIDQAHPNAILIHSHIIFTTKEGDTADHCKVISASSTVLHFLSIRE